MRSVRYLADTVSDIAEPSPPELDPVELLVRAIRTLAQPEQDAVFGYLLRQGASGRVDPGLGSLRRLHLARTEELSDVARREAARAVELPLLASATDASLRSVPVRFPEPLYERLKAWCSEHGFPMAAVIRGLVERFLDERGASSAVRSE